MPSVTSFTCSAIGANAVNLTVTDENGNVSSCLSTVTVRDTIKPVVTCIDTTIYLDAGGMVTIDSSYLYSAISDACGIATAVPSVTSFTCAAIGANAVTLTVTDENGNVSSCLSTVTVRDTIKPVVICQSLSVDLDVSGQASLVVSQIVTDAFDNCDIPTLTLSQTAFDCGDIGMNTVMVSATDVSGNIGTCTSSITINPLTIAAPIITGPAVVCQGLSDVSYEVTNPDATLSYTWELMSGTGIDITGTGSSASLNISGTATNAVVKVTATNACESVSSTFTITMGDAAFCELASCLRTSIYVDNELLQAAAAIQVYKVKNEISSDATVTKALTFKAGESIELFPNFTVNQGVIFIAQIEACLD
jgi:hypothetical protein